MGPNIAPAVSVLANFKGYRASFMMFYWPLQAIVGFLHDTCLVDILVQVPDSKQRCLESLKTCDINPCLSQHECELGLPNQEGLNLNPEDVLLACNLV